MEGEADEPPEGTKRLHSGKKGDEITIAITERNMFQLIRRSRFFFLGPWECSAGKVSRAILREGIFFLLKRLSLRDGTHA